MEEVAAYPSRLTCGICNRECSRYRKLKKHYKKWHTEQELLCCSFCDFVTINQSEMKMHKKAEHPQDRISCSHCHFSTRGWKKWKRHENGMHQGDSLVEDGQTQHEHHKTDDSSLICDNTDSPSEIEPKKKKPGGQEKKSDVQDVASSLSCQTTGAANLKDNSDLESRTVQGSDSVLQENSLHDIKGHKCHQCGKSFTFRSSLSRHKQGHKDTKLFECSISDFSMKHSHSLKDNELIHDSASQCCEFCGKVFSKVVHLTSHLRIHSDLKPFQCPYCEYSAIQKTTLEQHVRGHLGSKPYHCTICEYKTAYRSNLVLHAATHSIERPFPCQFCGRRFKRKDHLQTHIRLKHGDLP